MDANTIPRHNFRSIFDFENSYVNALYRAQPTWVAGALVVAGYLIITLLDIIWLCWYIIVAPIVMYSFFYGVPVFVRTLWTYLSGFLSGVLHIAEAICAYLPARAPARISPTEKAPVKTSLTNKPSSGTTANASAPESRTGPQLAKASPMKFFPANSSPITPSPLGFFAAKPPPTLPSTIEPIPKPTTEATAAKISLTNPTLIEPTSGTTYKETSTTITDAIPMKPLPVKRYPTRAYPVTANHSGTTPSNIVPSGSANSQNFSATTTEAAPRKAPSAKRYPTRASLVNSITSGGAPSNRVPAASRKNDQNPELINWLWEVPKLVLSTIYNHLDQFYILVLALLCVAMFYYSWETLPIPTLPSSLPVRKALSFRNGSRRTSGGFIDVLWSVTSTTSDFLGPLATWTHTIFFVALIPVVTFLSPLLVGVGAFLGFVTIAVFHQTLRTTYSAILFVFLSCSIVYGFRKAWPALFFLIIPALAYCTNTECFNAAAISIIALVFIAILAWATQLFIDFTRRTSPALIGLPFSILTWQPVFWALIFWIGRYQNFFHCSQVEQMQLYWNDNFYFSLFLFLATFKGIKVVVHTISYYLYTRPVQPLQNPTITPADVTVIVPTVGAFGAEFRACVRSILANHPARLIISTVGHARRMEGIRACHAIDPRIEFISVAEPNKRAQLIAAVEIVRTPITISVDDSVFWPRTFLRSALAPFEDPIVGLVGTSKRVIRNRSGSTVDSFFNYLACIYLERHNFECTASYNIDGGVFVISGRTVLARTSILHSIEYREKFQDDRFCGIGPMKVDDDNFNTRFMVNHGFKTVFQNDPRCTIVTTMGHRVFNFKKFKGQLTRWARTTWRSNLTSLLMDRYCYQRHPWTTYAMFISSLSNFALFYDFGIFYSLWRSSSSHMCAFVIILLLTKIIKPLPHLAREWRDWYFVPFGILFGWFHSFIKAWACLTMWDVQWSGREGIKATA